MAEADEDDVPHSSAAENLGTSGAEAADVAFKPADKTASPNPLRKRDGLSSAASLAPRSPQHFADCANAVNDNPASASGVIDNPPQREPTNAGLESDAAVAPGIQPPPPPEQSYDEWLKGERDREQLLELGAAARRSLLPSSRRLPAQRPTGSRFTEAVVVEDHSPFSGVTTWAVEFRTRMA